MAGRSGHRERLQRSEVVVVASGYVSIVVEKKEKVSSPPRQRRHSAVEALISYKRPQLGARGASADLVSQICKKGKEISSISRSLR